ncbi:MAG: SH3 domain-containing protein [Bacteroidales bacterium]|jgi:tetratricopeptide (TPR) repeat protein|nr:SH3 domain-containing protein [Bacteroidales bacterium]
MKSFSHIILFLLLITFSNRGVVAQESPDTTVQITSEAIPASSELLPEELSEKASEAYRRQDYRESTALYEALVAKGIAKDRISAEIYYNLGNAYFRDNQLGKAILNYERALLLDPGDGDIRHNLRFARNRTEDRIDTAGNLIFSTWFNAVRNIYSSNRWAVTGIVLFILFLVCLAVFLFVRFLWARKTAFYSGIVLFLLVIMANIFAFSQKSERIERESAIVMVGAASVNASPDLNSNELFQLHEGTKVKIRNSDSNWYEIEIANGSVGWIFKENVEII